MKFADAGEDYPKARFVIFGIPHEDREMSFRAGARLAPNAIRDASYNYESYHFSSGMELSEAKIHDAGNFELENGVEFIRRVVEDGKMPIAIGGAHSITPPLVSSIKGDFGVVILDAHMDFRKSYLGSPASHACTARRIFEMLGEDRVVSAGIRSVSKEEMEEAEKYGFIYYGMNSIKNLEEKIPFEKIYLSIDMDVFDPSIAPGVSNPEPFGAGYEVFDFLKAISSRIIAMDVVEVCPPYDDGSAALLAAATMREVIAWKARQH